MFHFLVFQRWEQAPSNGDEDNYESCHLWIDYLLLLSELPWATIDGSYSPLSIVEMVSLKQTEGNKGRAWRHGNQKEQLLSLGL